MNMVSGAALTLIYGAGFPRKLQGHIQEDSNNEALFTRTQYKTVLRAEGVLTMFSRGKESLGALLESQLHRRVLCSSVFWMDDSPGSIITHLI